MDADTARKLKDLLDQLTLDDIARFKAFSAQNPSSDFDGLLRSLRLYLDTKEIFDKQQLPTKAPEVPDKAQKALQDAMKKFDPDKMSQDEKEALARATIRTISNEQLKNLTAEQILESIVRVDKAAMASGKDMSQGVDAAIKGTGWERVAGTAQAVKGAAGFWAVLSFAALVFTMFVPGLNVLALAAHAMVAGMVAYAAATIQHEAEIKAAGSAKSNEAFQGHITRGTEARTQSIISAAAMALPVVGKMVGKIPLPGNLKNVATALNTAKTELGKATAGGFDRAKKITLDGIAKAKSDLQPYLIQFRQAIGDAARRIRRAKPTELVNEIRNTPELKGLYSEPTLKAMEKLSQPELEVARQNVLDVLNNAPEAADITVANIQAEIGALEGRVNAAKSAADLDVALKKAEALTDPEKLVGEAGTAAQAEVVQARVQRISDVSIADAKTLVDGMLKESQNLPSTHPKKAEVVKELQGMKKEIADLEKVQGSRTSRSSLRRLTSGATS